MNFKKVLICIVALRFCISSVALAASTRSVPRFCKECDQSTWVCCGNDAGATNSGSHHVSSGVCNCYTEKRASLIRCTNCKKATYNYGGSHQHKIIHETSCGGNQMICPY